MHMREHRQDWAAVAAWLVVVTVGAALALPATAAESDTASAQSAQQRADADRLFGSVVRIQTRAAANSRSAASLGAEREGTGVVIDDDGLVLTIGYLLIEAEQVTLTDSRGKTFPAKIVGYDHPTGFGLVRSLTPLPIKPIAIGDSTAARERTPVMVVNHDGRDDATLAFIVSRRSFTGNWEYAIDQAIFTSPPSLKWSGAALVDSDGKLLGIGSLILRDAASTSDGSVPGNMFVPIDLLKPILQDLLSSGHRAGLARPWLGVNADELQGRLVVARVSTGGPADKAGIQAGDIILAVNGAGVHTQAEFYDKLWSYGAAGAEIPLRVLHDIDVRDIKVRSIDRMEYFTARTTY